MVADEQLAAYLVGDVSDDEREDIERLLAEDPASLGELLSQRQLSAGLHALLGGDARRLADGILATTRGLSNKVMAGRIIAAQKRRAVLWKRMALAAVIALGAFGVFVWQRRQPVARVGRTVAAQWSAGDWRQGTPLRRGPLTLERGVAEIRLSKGATVVLEAPVDLELTGNNRVKLRDGRLRASVPPSAHGFKVDASGFSVVDLGTEFGVAVSRAADGSPVSEVHVFDGSVVVKTGTKHPLAANQAVRIIAGVVDSIPNQPRLFRGGVRLTAMEASAALAADPAALVYLDFEGGVTNRAGTGRNIVPEIVGCTPADGRWLGKGALEWKSADDRVRFTVPGELRAITLAAWVRVDALPNVQSSLLMSQSEMPGDMHWFLLKSGHLGFTVIRPDGGWQGSFTPSPVTRATQGEWLFLATTFDGSTVTHYLNGHPVSQQPFTGALPLRPGAVELGNWGIPPGAPLRASRRSTEMHNSHIRNLDGRMDEFALFSTALSASEIFDFHHKTRPE